MLLMVIFPRAFCVSRGGVMQLVMNIFYKWVGTTTTTRSLCVFCLWFVYRRGNFHLMKAYSRRSRITGPRVFLPDGKDSQDSVILLADDDDAVARRKIMSFGAWFLKDPGPRWEFSYRYWGPWIQMKRRNSMTFHQRMNTPAEVDVLCLP